MKRYEAKMFVETGYGLVVKKAVFNAMNTMMMNIEGYIKAVENKGMKVSKIIFSYPSGKTFTQKY